MKAHEKRQDVRLQVFWDVDVQVGLRRISGVLQNVSLGGAEFFVPESIGAIGDKISIALPILSEQAVEVDATIVRCQTDQRGYTFGIRFDLTKAAKQQLVEQLQRLLLGRPSELQEPRQQQYAVVFQGAERLEAALSGLSNQGCTLSCEVALSASDEVTILLPNSDGQALLAMQGRVVERRPILNREPAMFHIGLAFLHLDGRRSRCLKEILQMMHDDD